MKGVEAGDGEATFERGYGQTELYSFCHHRASCGTRAQPGPQRSTQDPSQTNNGVLCFCEGRYPENPEQGNGHCYVGSCDYGRPRHSMRRRRRDEVLEFERENKLDDANKDAEMFGLCKFRQILDNRVDFSLCVAHRHGDVDVADPVFTDEPTRDYAEYARAMDEAAKGDKESSAMPMSPRDRIDQFFAAYIKKEIAEKSLEEPGA